MKRAIVFAGIALWAYLSGAASGQELKIDPKLKVSKVAYAGMQAALDFAQGFEKTHGRLPQDVFVGFQMATNSDTQFFDAGVYHLAKDGKLATDLYSCYFHMSNSEIKSARCRDEKVRDVAEYEAAPRQFKFAEFQNGLVAMLDFFKTKHSKPSRIRDIKMWHGDKSFEFRVTSVQGEERAIAYIMCGNGAYAMNCQDRSQPGGHEPVDF